MRRVFVCFFLEEIEGTKKPFRNYLTFSKRQKNAHEFLEFSPGLATILLQHQLVEIFCSFKAYSSIWKETKCNVQYFSMVRVLANIAKYRLSTLPRKTYYA